jgi:pyridoxamine 5'-phosphate oxidase
MTSTNISLGSFKQPPPGQPRDKPYNKDENKMGEKLTGLDDPVARKNFRVMVIKPEKVEELNLDPESAGRKQYTFNEETHEWDLVETWP